MLSCHVDGSYAAVLPLSEYCEPAARTSNINHLTKKNTMQVNYYRHSNDQGIDDDTLRGIVEGIIQSVQLIQSV